ncbi:single-stranded DNA-binding protein [Paraburkholderia silvatlantica]|uniref:single-stranded DNA-binding protein n=1 Tax=Paraburkholderia silvatlantica TaxID=321895 RepID=UPI0037536B59
MGLYAELIGNVLASPTMKQVNTAGGARRIVEMRVMSASYRRLEDGTLKQRDERTFPVDVTIWNERLTERVLQHIRTGASVVVRGDFYVSPWITRENEVDAGAHMDAESISLNLVRIDQVVYRARQPRDAGEQDHDDAALGNLDDDSPENVPLPEAAPPQGETTGEDADASRQSAGRRSRRASGASTR